MENAIEIYRTADGTSQIAVQFKQETVWLSQQQLSELFGRERTVISKHIKNIFSEGELEEQVVCANFAQTTVHGAMKGKTQETSTRFYNLDVIISVGYRVKSQRGTQFRQWATQRLKDYLVQGYALNEKRLSELAQTVQIIQQSLESQAMPSREAQGLIQVLGHYTQSYILLNQFDSNTLLTDHLTEHITYEIAYPEAKQAIGELKNQINLIKS